LALSLSVPRTKIAISGSFSNYTRCITRHGQFYTKNTRIQFYGIGIYFGY